MPAVVPGLPPPLLPLLLPLPPQAAWNRQATKTIASSKQVIRVFPLTALSAAPSNIAGTNSQIAHQRIGRHCLGDARAADDAAVVEIVRVEVVPFPLGVTAVGLREHVGASLEADTEQVRLTELLKPLTGATVIVAFEDCPGFTVAGENVADVTVKSITTWVMAVEVLAL